MTHPDRDMLARQLRDLRAPRFRSGSALARHLGWAQSKVSRIENGQQLPSRTDLDQWAEAIGTHAAELHDLLDRAHVQTVSTRAAVRSQRGLPGAQADLGLLEETSARIAEYQPHMVPGLAQTAGYARAWLSQPDRPTTVDVLDIEGIVEARLARQRLLYGERRVTLAMGIGALERVHGDVAVQRQQLSHLQVIAELPAVELLIEPAAAAMATVRGFELLDDRVILEDTDGARHLTDEAVVARFATSLDALRKRALAGCEALSAIDAIAARL
ncbi:MAG: helix-turn-helix transcriptional regulator [Pseudonocardia sp.]|nr:helix-turn-helix transcriptional regulator [Pseudonocardia sp.]